jgi:hypothetical protein
VKSEQTYTTLSIKFLGEGELLFSPGYQMVLCLMLGERYAGFLGGLFARWCSQHPLKQMGLENFPHT